MIYLNNEPLHTATDRQPFKGKLKNVAYNTRSHTDKVQEGGPRWCADHSRGGARTRAGGKTWMIFLAEQVTLAPAR